MPGCMMFLGVMPEGHHEHGHIASCHSNHMILNEDAMAVGIAAHAAIAHRYLTGPRAARKRPAAPSAA
jgi:hippurate hydrolase